MNILLTGGTGYIGSHTAVVLADAGHRVVLYDNLANSEASVVDRLEKITGTRLPFVEADVRSTDHLASTLESSEIEAVIHFAGLKAVGESVGRPLVYYDNNVGGTMSVLNAMIRVGVRKLVFSSSASVYGDPQYLPIDEAHPRSAINPYGRTKLQIENILEDLAASDRSWRISCLRYFNPVGAHESSLIGEAPQGTPANLMPYVAQVAAGQRKFLNVWGDDYPTFDGTGVRDYIHVCDLAEGHVAALDYLNSKGEMLTVNLGTGQGYSVLEMVKAFEKASGHAIPCKVGPRRIGDSAKCWADSTLAQQLMGWKASRSLEQMCADAWRWQQSARS
jgi:UDP-glucose 4-epimerase